VYAATAKSVVMKAISQQMHSLAKTAVSFLRTRFHQAKLEADYPPHYPYDKPCRRTISDGSFLLTHLFKRSFIFEGLLILGATM
jgi:hypothetical protein